MTTPSSTLHVDAHYIHSLIEGGALVFEDGTPEATLNAMKHAEDAAIRLHLARAYERAGMAAPDWIAIETAASVRGCAQVVRSFLTTPTKPTEEETTKFERAISQWALLEPGNVWKEVDRSIREAVVPSAPVKNYDEWDVLVGWLHRLNAAQEAVDRARDQLPSSVAGDPFAALKDTIIKDVRHEVVGAPFRLGLREAIRAMRPVRFKKKPHDFSS